MTLLVFFAVSALLLAAVGIYGLISYTVTQRTKEIIIRVALGAGRSRMLGQIVSRGVIVVGTGLLVGLFASFGLSRLMSSLLFEVSPTDPGSYAVVCLLILGVALLSSVLGSLRTMRVEPMQALRFE